MDISKLFHIGVEHSAAVFEVEASVVATEAAALHNVAATHDARGLVEVDVAVDIRRQIVGKARGIVGDQDDVGNLSHK